jgi:hypothetical protein
VVVDADGRAAGVLADPAPTGAADR